MISLETLQTIVWLYVGYQLGSLAYAAFKLHRLNKEAPVKKFEDNVIQIPYPELKDGATPKEVQIHNEMIGLLVASGFTFSQSHQ